MLGSFGRQSPYKLEDKKCILSSTVSTQGQVQGDLFPSYLWRSGFSDPGLQE